MTVLHPERLELHPRIAVEMQAQKRALWIVVSAILVLTVIALALAARGLAAHDVDWGAIGNTLWKKIQAAPWRGAFHGFVLTVVVGHFYYLWRVQMRERLVLTHSGIEFRSPLPSWVPWLPKSWSLDWGSIRTAALRAGLPGANAPQLVVMEVEARGRKHRLYPYRWVDPAQSPTGFTWNLRLQARRLSKEAINAQIDDSPLLRYAVAALPQLKVQRASELLQQAFAIEKNRAALTVTIAFFVLIGYALVDGAFLVSETYAGEAPLDAFAIIGIAVMAFAALWMMRNRVPLAESFFIALLAGAAAGAAAYPGMLRVNALTDTEGLKSHEYELVAGAELHPRTEGLPVLYFPRYADYWAHFPNSSVHVFELRRGGLGFYQLHVAPIEQDMKSFYRKQTR